MDYGSETLASVVKALSRLPGIGTKTAQRLALYLLRSRHGEAEELLAAADRAPGAGRILPHLRGDHRGTGMCNLHGRLAVTASQYVWWSSRRTCSCSKTPASSGVCTTSCMEFCHRSTVSVRRT